MRFKSKKGFKRHKSKSSHKSKRKGTRIKKYGSSRGGIRL